MTVSPPPSCSGVGDHAFVNMFGSFLSTSAQNMMGMSKLICVLFAEGCLTLMMAFSTTYILATASFFLE